MNQQDELEKLIRKIDETTDGLGEWHEATEYLEWVRKEVQRILIASRPRVVETVEELDALPVGSVVLDKAGDVGKLICDYSNDPAGELLWELAGYGATFGASDVDLPATVIHLPEEKP